MFKKRIGYKPTIFAYFIRMIWSKTFRYFFRMEGFSLEAGTKLHLVVYKDRRHENTGTIFFIFKFLSWLQVIDYFFHGSCLCVYFLDSSQHLASLNLVCFTIWGVPQLLLISWLKSDVQNVLLIRPTSLFFFSLEAPNYNLEDCLLYSISLI